MKIDAAISTRYKGGMRQTPLDDLLGGCSVELLIPDESHALNVFRTQEYSGINSYAVRIGQWIDACSEALRKKARKLALPISIRERQLHFKTGPGKDRWQAIAGSHVLATIDPDEELLARMIDEGLKKNPLMRLLLATTEKNGMDALMHPIMEQKVEMFIQNEQGWKLAAVPRIYAYEAKTSDEDDPHMEKAVQHALTFPYVDTVKPRSSVLPN